MAENSTNDLPFEAGAWLIERNDPGRPGRFTGCVQRMGRLLMLQLEYPPTIFSSKATSSIGVVFRFERRVPTIKGRWDENFQ